MANLKRLESPNEILVGAQPGSTPWQVLGNAAKTVKSWRKLVEKCPEDTTFCYKHLSTQTPHFKMKFFTNTKVFKT